MGNFFGDAVVEREAGGRLATAAFLVEEARGICLDSSFLPMILVAAFFKSRDGRRALRDDEVFFTEAPRASRFILLPALRALWIGFFSTSGSKSVYSSSSDSEERFSSGS